MVELWSEATLDRWLRCLEDTLQVCRIALAYQVQLLLTRVGWRDRVNHLLYLLSAMAMCSVGKLRPILKDALCLGFEGGEQQQLFVSPIREF